MSDSQGIMLSERSQSQKFITAWFQLYGFLQVTHFSGGGLISDNKVSGVGGSYNFKR